MGHANIVDKKVGRWRSRGGSRWADKMRRGGERVGRDG
jgi:hypothetical protein